MEIKVVQIMETANSFKNSYYLNNIKIEFNPIEELYGMCGPWICDLTINGEKISGKFGAPPLILEDKELIFLPIYIDKGKKQKIFKFGQKEEGFAIAVFDIKELSIWVSKQLFRLLYIEKFKNNKIIIYESNNNEIDDKRREIIFNNNNFNLYSKFSL